jgi:cytidine deaminase
MNEEILKNEYAQLLDAASKVLEKAYAPYSNFRVGAAILTEKGNIFVGCNVENAAYDVTICAERAAICAAIAYESGDEMKICAIAISAEQDVPCAPCGSCRQMIFEFNPDAIVIFKGQHGFEELSVSELLPNGFSLFKRDRMIK